MITFGMKFHSSGYAIYDISPECMLYHIITVIKTNETKRYNKCIVEIHYLIIRHEDIRMTLSLHDKNVKLINMYSDLYDITGQLSDYDMETGLTGKKQQI